MFVWKGGEKGKKKELDGFVLKNTLYRRVKI